MKVTFFFQGLILFHQREGGEVKALCLNPEGNEHTPSLKWAFTGSQAERTIDPLGCYIRLLWLYPTKDAKELSGSVNLEGDQDQEPAFPTTRDEARMFKWVADLRHHVDQPIAMDNTQLGPGAKKEVGSLISLASGKLGTARLVSDLNPQKDEFIGVDFDNSQNGNDLAMAEELFWVINNDEANGLRIEARPFDYLKNAPGGAGEKTVVDIRDFKPEEGDNEIIISNFPSTQPADKEEGRKAGNHFKHFYDVVDSAIPMGSRPFPKPTGSKHKLTGSAPAFPVRTSHGFMLPQSRPICPPGII